VGRFDGRTMLMTGAGSGIDYLAPDDVVSLSIDGLGTQTQRLRPA
jgi:2-keto-4-pentenoate hydratase/2-oxohepta-3-ene-1,7-dioic acid hydratase in catechol pathway